jgi:putative oxidoreductase
VGKAVGLVRQKVCGVLKKAAGPDRTRQIAQKRLVHRFEQLIMSRNSAWIHYGNGNWQLGLEARVEYVFLLGRILYGGFFILGGINHFTSLGMMSGFVASKGVPAGKAAIIFSGLLIILGGFCIVVGCRPEIGVLCIVVFLVPVTFMMHAYWQESDPMQRINQRVNFQKNLALLGAALLLLFIPRPWPFSLNFP